MAQKNKFFGTDGVRGTANEGHLTPESALRLGQIAAEELILCNDNKNNQRPIAIIGKDTRRSGDMLESALSAGLNSAGIDVKTGGVIPTPAVALLVKEMNADLGVVISASHNAPPDNGIKFFCNDGYKLSLEQEDRLEKKILSGQPITVRATGEKIGRTTPLVSSIETYVSKITELFIKETSDKPLSGMRITLDAANGASYETSQRILESLGADLVCHFNAPDGDNINLECGCTHPEILSSITKEDQSFIGISHDGDADRILMCDENADPIDGDELMAIIGCHMLTRNELSANTVVGTKMSNYGLDECIKDHKGTLVRSEIGDRNVMEKMRSIGSNFGGEPSGHVIYRNHNTTGDGIVAALAAMKVVLQTEKSLSELRKVINKFPQKLVNLSVSKKIKIEELKANDLIETTQADLGEQGRVLIRYSGTEPKIRILVEGKDEEYVISQATKIAESIHNEIGS
ncbi:MAG: phosphoglucosamine mutase [Verrucomicrobiales bacterium]|jgi:phosphoglucosamine mutase|nr:phosphoglucosamine mutase [Verrucomicrobiales bacterium]